MINIDPKALPSHEDLLADRQALDAFRGEWRRNHQCAICRGKLQGNIERCVADEQLADQLYVRPGDLVCFYCHDACLALDLDWGHC